MYNRFSAQRYIKQQTDCLDAIVQVSDCYLPVAVHLKGSEVVNEIPLFYRMFKYEIVYISKCSTLPDMNLDYNNLVTDMITFKHLPEQYLVGKNRISLCVNLEDIYDVRDILKGRQILDTMYLNINKSGNFSWEILGYCLGDTVKNLVILGNPRSYLKLSKTSSVGLGDVIDTPRNIADNRAVVKIVNVNGTPYEVDSLISTKEISGLIKNYNVLLDTTPDIYPGKFPKITPFNYTKQTAIVTNRQKNIDFELIFNMDMYFKYRDEFIKM